MRTAITFKKTGAVAAFLFCFFTLANAAGVQSFNEVFSEMGNWSTQNSSTSTVSGGHLNCTMALSGTKYRGDMWYNFSGNAANNLTLNPANDVYLAVKFIGNRPSGALKMEFNTGSAWFNSQWNGGSADGNISTTSNNKIYYFRLTKDANYTGTSITVNKLHFIIADATVAPFSYTVDWVGTFASLADLTAYADTKDDGVTDTDEGTIDPATLPGYINDQYSGGTDNWVKNVNESAVWNNGKLIFSSTSADLQVKKTGVTMNATNFPYLAVKVDKFPVGSTRFKIQTNCAGTSVYDSWYSVVAQKGDVYVFDMANCVNKNTSATQSAITTTNAADLWIDFGNTTIGEMAQLGWVKTYQTLAEIPTETADPLAAETDANAGKIGFEYNTDNLSTAAWDWRTVHWADGENGCKVSSSNGQLVMDPNAQIGSITRNAWSLNTTNYPYIAIKVDDKGDAQLFKFELTSLTKGTYSKYSNGSAVTMKGSANNIYVFDVSSLPTISTATDAFLRLDFYQDLLATANPTLPVKIDWIHSYKTLAEITDITTAVTDASDKSKAFAVISPSGLTVYGVSVGAGVVVYNALGAKVAQKIAKDNVVNIPVSGSGVFVVEVTGNGQISTMKVAK